MYDLALNQKYMVDKLGLLWEEPAVTLTVQDFKYQRSKVSQGFFFSLPQEPPLDSTDFRTLFVEFMQIHSATRASSGVGASSLICLDCLCILILVEWKAFFPNYF